MSKLSDWMRENVEVRGPFERKNPLKHHDPLGKSEHEKIKVTIGGPHLHVMGMHWDPDAPLSENLRRVRVGCVMLIVFVILSILFARLFPREAPKQPAAQPTAPHSLTQP